VKKYCLIANIRADFVRIYDALVVVVAVVLFTLADTQLTIRDVQTAGIYRQIYHRALNDCFF